MCLLKSTDAHESRDLTNGNVNGGTCHETADSRSWNEFDEPSKTEKTYAKHDKASDERQGSRDFRTLPLSRMLAIYVLDDLRYG